MTLSFPPCRFLHWAVCLWWKLVTKAADDEQLVIKLGINFFQYPCMLWMFLSPPSSRRCPRIVAASFSRAKKLVAAASDRGTYGWALGFNRVCMYLCFYNETLDHIPSSCIFLMVHMVKGRQYNAYTLYEPHRCRRLNRQDGVWDRLSTSTVTNFNASITGNGAVQLPNFRWSWHTCSARAI